MKNRWTYRDFEIIEGLKPGSKTFRYFFRMFEGEKKSAIYASGLLMTSCNDSIHQAILTPLPTPGKTPGTAGSGRKSTAAIFGTGP